MTDVDKDDIISKIYFDRSGRGSIQATYQDAKRTKHILQRCTDLVKKMLSKKENKEVLILLLHLIIIIHIK